MKKGTFLIIIGAVLAGFIGGFLVANALNRKEMDTLRAENARLQKIEKEAGEQSLSDDEIKSKIAEADKNPDNLEYQKNLAFALYRYANAKQDADLLGEVKRLLERVYEKEPQNLEVIATLGNLNLDIGQIKLDDERIIKAREFYQKALSLKPKEIEIQCDLGLTYLLLKEPDADKAISELQKALAVNANHEKSLNAMAQAFLLKKNIEEAEKYLMRLKGANPQNQSIEALESQISQIKNK